MDNLEARLQAYLQKKMPENKALSISDFNRVPYGGSKETYLFHLQWLEARGKKSGNYALRYEAPDNILEVGVGKEANVFQNLTPTDIPVPAFFWAESDAEVLGRPFMVVEQVSGDVTSFGKLVGGDDAGLRTARAEAAVSLISKVHSLNWEEQDFSFLGLPRSRTSFAEDQLKLWKSLYDQSKLEPAPIIADAFEWLKRNIPETTKLTLVHGDLKTDNFMYNDGAVRALLDWEMAEIGDPLSDLAWFCMKPWEVDGLSGGMIKQDDLIAGWQQKTGFDVDKDAYLFWQVFSCFKLLAIHSRMSHSLVTGANTAIMRVVGSYLNPSIYKEICKLLNY